MVLRVALANADELVACGLRSVFRSQGQDFELVERTPGQLVDILLYETCPTEPQQPRHDVARLRGDRHVRCVVVYTWNFLPWLASDYIRQGASGYLAKNLSAAELVAALRTIHAGRVVVAPLQPGDREGSVWPGQDEGLTAREAEVLSLITAGLSNDDLATRLGLSHNSIKSHIRLAYRKIGVASRSQAVLWGMRHGLGSRPHHDLTVVTSLHQLDAGLPPSLGD